MSGHESPTVSQKPKVQFTIRDAQFKELPAAARLMTLAFWDDQIFGDLVHPKREQYPHDLDLYWLRERRVNFWNPHYKLIVAVIKDADAPGGEKVIGIAEWERLGDGAKALERAKLDPSMSTSHSFPIIALIHAISDNAQLRKPHEPIHVQSHGHS